MSDFEDENPYDKIPVEGNVEGEEPNEESDEEVETEFSFEGVEVDLPGEANDDH